MKKYLEYKDSRSSKFWEIEVNAASHTVRYGKIGTDGQRMTKDFDSKEEALGDAEKLVTSKLKKGYAETSPGIHPSEDGITAQDVLKLIDALRLPDVVRRIFLQEGVPTVVASLNHFYSPYPFFDMTKEEQSIYGNGLIYPLLSGPDFYRITGYDIKKKKYVVFDIEDSVDRDTATYYTWEQILVKEFCPLISHEFRPLSLEQTSELAKLFNFPYALTIHEEYNDRNFTNYDEIVKWEEGLVKKFSKSTR